MILRIQIGKLAILKFNLITAYILFSISGSYNKRTLTHAVPLLLLLLTPVSPYYSTPTDPCLSLLLL